MIESIVAMRESGLTCRQVAQKLKIPEHRVWNAMRQTGRAGKIRNREQQIPLPDMKDLLDSFDYLGFETTTRGAYICTIGEVSGEERSRMKDAVRSAYKKLLSKEQL